MRIGRHLLIVLAVLSAWWAMTRPAMAQFARNPACTSYGDIGQTLPNGLFRACFRGNQSVLDTKTDLTGAFQSYQHTVLSGAGSMVSTAYDFPAQTPGIALFSATPATVTLTPCPVGVNGADSLHYLYV